MKMRIDESDIYDIQVDDIYGDTINGCEQGFSDFEIDPAKVEVIQDDNIKIKISGKCACFGYHNDIPCTFEGALTMDADNFTYEYTNAAEEGNKYIEFSGNIEISHTLEQGISLDDTVIDDNFKQTTYNILHKINSYEIDMDIEDEQGNFVLDSVVHSIIINAKDKIIKEIERIDNIELDEFNKFYIKDYLSKNNILDHYAVKDDKYKSIDAILLAQTAEDIKNGKIADVINYEYGVTSYEECDVTAKVYFSDLD